jgi:hypothetical protein
VNNTSPGVPGPTRSNHHKPRIALNRADRSHRASLPKPGRTIPPRQNHVSDTLAESFGILCERSLWPFSIHLFDWSPGRISWGMKMNPATLIGNEMLLKLVHRQPQNYSQFHSREIGRSSRKPSNSSKTHGARCICAGPIQNIRHVISELRTR